MGKNLAIAHKDSSELKMCVNKMKTMLVFLSRIHLNDPEGDRVESNEEEVIIFFCFKLSFESY